MSVDKPVIDLGHRKPTCDTHLIAGIKGERRHKAMRDAFDANRVSPLDALYATPTPSDPDLRAVVVGGEVRFRAIMIMVSRVMGSPCISLTQLAGHSGQTSSGSG